MENNKTLLDWQRKKYSMFIHWGIYSILAGIWNNKKIEGYSEQIKGHAQISSEEYRKLAKKFNPSKWDADYITDLAIASGMKSIIFTAKHHDGFCMFKSKYTDFNVVDLTPYAKDIVKELANACRLKSLNFGLYYSLIDWDYDGALPFTSVNNSDLIPNKHHQFNINQVKELLTNYGEISELWFDMGSPTFEQSKELVEVIKQIQPNCLVSGRIWNDQGDFVVMGDNYKPTFKMAVPWQAPASIFNETWGYRSWQKRENCKNKIKEKITDLLNIVSSGGNYLLNIGPKEDGSIVPFEENVLRGVGNWLKESGEGIYASFTSIIDKPDWGFITSKERKLYFHITNKPDDNIIKLSGLKISIDKIYPLSDKSLSLEFSDLNGLEIVLPDKVLKNEYANVIVFQYNGEYKYLSSKIIYPDENGNFYLDNSNSEYYHSYSGHDYYSYKPTIVMIKWSLAIPSVARYSLKSSLNNQELKLKIDEKTLHIPSIASEKNNLIHKLIGEVDLDKDICNVELSLINITNPNRGIDLNNLSISFSKIVDISKQ
ncbi:MAG: alpha-L-fucosidase [Candidatus Delongbacteria bacterium]|nr:alpha-L-fucosidase [Candidatus Delongbacteria bacterium]MBN2835059.1 alpha-L-fucosidase [Candidatus Delongbacteria bacterium]